MGNTSAFGGLETLALTDDGIYCVTVLADQEVERVICYTFQDMSHFFRLLHAVVRFAAKGEHVLYIRQVGFIRCLSTRRQLLFGRYLSTSRFAKQGTHLFFARIPAANFCFVVLEPHFGCPFQVE